jgi:hypothetical protein
VKEKKGALALFVLGLAARLGVALWAGSHFPPAGDGFFYDSFARRLAHGDGYTWLWGDGTVTYAAHYPVGYPALLALPYLIFGAQPIVAGVINAIVGAFAGVAVHALAGGGRRGLIGGALVALHPALVLYTPAVMTEGIATTLVAVAAALAFSPRFRPRVRLVLAGLVLGVATLVRPQSLLFAPLLAVCALDGWRERAIGVVLATLVTVGVCVPWTARNCMHMHRCALVSVNAGWNLLIGTQTDAGGWQEVDVPTECRTVWDEAEKDVCFERAAKRAIAAHPRAWLRRIPAKLRTTLDYFGAGPWYLRASNADRFSDRAKLGWGIAETIASRGLLLAAFFSRAWLGRRRAGPIAAGILGAILACTQHAGWLAYLVLAVLVLGTKPRRVDAFSALVIVSTAAVHAVFFGAGRYGLAIVPFVALLAVSGLSSVERREYMPA